MTKESVNPTWTDTEMAGLWNIATNEAKKAFDEKVAKYGNDYGACGFAWVNIKPGNSRFAKWLKANKYARSDDYCGGVTIWISVGGQSIDLKETYAIAMAKVFKDAGFNAYAASRLD